MKTELRDHGGQQRLFVDGKVHHGLFCSTPAPYMKGFIAAGFDIFDTHPHVADGWVGPGRYDYAATDEKIESYLRQKSDALLIVRFWMGVDQAIIWPKEPTWWSAQNPGETLRTSRDAGKHPFRWCPSFASLRWRAEAGEALRRAVEHLEGKYGDRIVAYVPGGGPCGEWFHWYAYGGEADLLEDYSESMRRAYHADLQRRYGDVAHLNQAWGTRLAAFADIELPRPEDRLKARLGNLRSAGQERAILEFYETFNQQVADTLVHWCAQVKQGCQRNKVVMTFYGYLWHHQPGVVQARSGHIDLDRVLASPDVDYLVAPFHYSLRQTEGVISGQAPVSSAIRRGKQYLHELDGSTCLKTCWPCPGHHVPADAAETGEIMRRDLGKVLTDGASAWYMDLVGGMYDHPDLVAELRRALLIAQRHALRAGGNNRQVAVVLGPREPFYYREGERLLVPLVSMFKQFELERMGLGYDDLTVDDLAHLDPRRTEQYRFWIFPSAVGLTDREVELVRRHACRNGNHVLWNYAVGVCRGDGLDLDRMERITGLRCGCTLQPGEAAVAVDQSVRHAFLEQVPRSLVYGTRGDLSADQIKHHAALGDYPSSQEGFQVVPRFCIERCDTVLGHVENWPGDTRPVGLGVRDMGSWVSIFSVAPLLPKQILRNVARAAGCHVWTDFLGQSFHCENYFGIYFHASGPCRIRFPRRCRVTDIVGEATIAEGVDEIEVGGEINRTLLLRYE